MSPCARPARSYAVRVPPDPMRRLADLATISPAHLFVAMAVTACWMDGWQGHNEEMIVNLAVQFKAVSDLEGITVEKGARLKDCENVKHQAVEERQYFARETPFQHVGGKLRVRISSINSLPQSSQLGHKIYVRIISGQESRYGHKLRSPKQQWIVEGQAEGNTRYSKTRYTSPVSDVELLAAL